MSGKTKAIRLIVVDTPESVKPNSPVQCYGHKASAFTKQHLDDTTVRLVADPEGDKYNRLLRYVYLQDGTLWNQRLIASGHGFAYLSFPFSKSQDFAVSQPAAQSAKLGLWATCATYQESGGRWQTNNL